MKNVQCPKCGEEVRAEAVVCRYCQEKLAWSREEVVMTAMTERIQFVAGSLFKKPEASACGAFCYSHFSQDKVRLNECLDVCKEAQAIAAVAEKLQRELIMTFTDLVWGGGDIDPVPFERAVRERFSRGPMGVPRRSPGSGD